MTARSPRLAMSSLVLRLLVLAAAVGAVFLLLTSVGAAHEPPAPTTTYIVDPGDTLWNIAGAVTAPGRHRAVVVDEIMALNQLVDATIYPGQALAVPIG